MFLRNVRISPNLQLAVCFWCLALFIHRSWRWTGYVPPKQRNFFEQHGVKTRRSYSSQPTLWEPQLQHETPHTVPQHFLSSWLYGPLEIFASLTTGINSSLIRHISLGFLPHTVLRGEVAGLTHRPQPGATLRLAPTLRPVYNGWSYQELTPRKHSSPGDQGQHTSSLR
jgi:hypothetical protein